MSLNPLPLRLGGLRPRGLRDSLRRVLPPAPIPALSIVAEAAHVHQKKQMRQPSTDDPCDLPHNAFGLTTQ
jgi:hypothetical protein